MVSWPIPKNLLMMKVTCVQEIESEIGHSFCLGSVLLSSVTAGQEIESEAGV